MRVFEEIQHGSLHAIEFPPDDDAPNQDAGYFDQFVSEVRWHNAKRTVKNP